MSRVVVVTGSNKGIGFAAVKLLLQQQPEFTVYLTARDRKRGEDAVNDLKRLGLNPKFYQLESIRSFKDYLRKEHGGLDVLINNAAINYRVDSDVPFGKQARDTIATNYFGTLNVCKEFFPIFRDHARVVNVSSRSGHSAYSKLSPTLKDAFKNCTTLEEIDQLMETFVNLAEEGRYETEGWVNNTYGTSKIGITVAASIQQRMIDSDQTRRDIIVNACTPGYVNTDMTNHEGPLTPEQGASSLVYLATLPENTLEPRGRFVTEDRVISELF